MRSFCVRGLLSHAVEEMAWVERSPPSRGPPQAPLLENGQPAARRARPPVLEGDTHGAGNREVVQR